MSVIESSKKNNVSLGVLHLSLPLVLMRVYTELMKKIYLIMVKIVKLILYVRNRSTLKWNKENEKRK